MSLEHPPISTDEAGLACAPPSDATKLSSWQLIGLRS